MGNLIKFPQSSPNIVKNTIPTINGDIVKIVHYDEDWNIMRTEEYFPDGTGTYTEWNDGRIESGQISRA